MLLYVLTIHDVLHCVLIHPYYVSLVQIIFNINSDHFLYITAGYNTQFNFYILTSHVRLIFIPYKFHRFKNRFCPRHTILLIVSRFLREINSSLLSLQSNESHLTSKHLTILERKAHTRKMLLCIPILYFDAFVVYPIEKLLCLRRICLRSKLCKLELIR